MYKHQNFSFEHTPQNCTSNIMISDKPAKTSAFCRTSVLHYRHLAYLEGTVQFQCKIKSCSIVDHVW